LVDLFLERLGVSDCFSKYGSYSRMLRDEIAADTGCPCASLNSPDTLSIGNACHIVREHRRKQTGKAGSGTPFRVPLENDFDYLVI
jgi:hypothetical protein